MQFYELASPESLRGYGTPADWDEGVHYEGVSCPVHEGHRRAGKRLGKLKVVLSTRKIGDFVWTWGSECLIQDRVLRLFRQQGFSGFTVRPAEARFIGRSGRVLLPRFWELVVLGWAGMAPAQSGIRLVKHFECCGHRQYSSCKDPDRLIDPQRWDGSDFFMVWPLPLYRFVSERVARFIQEERLTGCQLIPVEKLKFAHGGFTPGQLSNYMPQERAHSLEESLSVV